jgi:secreted trypsin-like serine protease
LALRWFNHFVQLHFDGENQRKIDKLSDKNGNLLQAAHCVYQMSVAELFIGSIDRRYSAPFETTVQSNNFILHESYNDNSLINDIALIRTPAIPINNGKWIQNSTRAPPDLSPSQSTSESFHCHLVPKLV